jgi:hypothetical protein
MGQQQIVAEQEAGSALKRIILVLAVAAVMAIMAMAITSEPAFAKGLHISGCQEFGERVSGNAKNTGGNGELSQTAQGDGLQLPIKLTQIGECGLN